MESYRRLDNSCKEKIFLEIEKIDNLIEKSSVLISKCNILEPDFIEVNAIGSVLHSFYNGLESIFKLIYKSYNEKSLSSRMWHSELLTEMFKIRKNGTTVLSQELLNDLKEYLGFRHVFRHSYGYEMDWNRLAPLFKKMPIVWNNVKKCILNFKNHESNAE